MSKAKRYLDNNLNNEYVNHCTRLHNELREIPGKMYKKYLEYLKNLVDQNCGQYKQYESSQAYEKRKEFGAINEELNQFVTECSEYGVSENKAKQDLKPVLEKWEEDIKAAYSYTYSK
jgi:ribonucleotide reductase beta subunit family protein with ferritin-like domain